MTVLILLNCFLSNDSKHFFGEEEKFHSVKSGVAN